MTLELLVALTVPLALLAGLIVAVVALFRRAAGGGGESADPGIGVLRRLYYYVLGLAALSVGASGVSLVLRGLIEAVSGKRVLAGGESELALALALTFVGVPLWLYLWSLAQRSVRRHPVEAGSLIRKLYVYLVLGGAAAIAAGSLAEFSASLLGVGDFRPGNLAAPIVMAGVWVLHWRNETVEGQPTETARLARRLYVYITAGYGLVMACVGAGMALAGLLTAAYDAAVGTAILATGGAPWGREAREGAALVLVGGVWWAWHWFRVANPDGPSDLRHIYLYVFAALAGAVTGVVGLSLIVQGTLQWTLGDAEAATAASHFRLLPGALTALILGAGVWGYHAAVIHGEPGVLAGGQSAVRRVYRYLIAAVGLVALASGLVLLLGAALGVITPQAGTAIAGGDWWKEPFSWGVTLTLVGGALWGRYWRVLQGAAAARPAEERGSQSRRSYLYAVAGVAVLIALGNLSALLFVLFRDLLEGRLAASALHESKWSIAALLMAAAVGVYHWLTLRQDQEAVPAEPEDRESAPADAEAVPAPSAIAGEEQVGGHPKSVIVLAAWRGAGPRDRGAPRLRRPVVARGRRSGRPLSHRRRRPRPPRPGDRRGSGRPPARHRRRCSRPRRALRVAGASPRACGATLPTPVGRVGHALFR